MFWSLISILNVYMNYPQKFKHCGTIFINCCRWEMKSIVGQGQIITACIQGPRAMAHFTFSTSTSSTIWVEWNITHRASSLNFGRLWRLLVNFFFRTTSIIRICWGICYALKLVWTTELTREARNYGTLTVKTARAAVRAAPWPPVSLGFPGFL